MAANTKQEWEINMFSLPLALVLLHRPSVSTRENGEVNYFDSSVSRGEAPIMFGSCPLRNSSGPWAGPAVVWDSFVHNCIWHWHKDVLDCGGRGEATLCSQLLVRVGFLSAASSAASVVELFHS